MEHKILPLTVNNYYRTVIDILSFSEPFSKMRPREKDVFARLLEYNERYVSLSERDKSKLIFDADVYEEIGTKLGCSKEVITNVLSELRNKNVIIKVEKGYEIINIKYVIPKLDMLSFKIKEKNE